MKAFQETNTVGAVLKKGQSSRALREKVEEGEAAEERVMRLYKSPGGPLIGWLFDEAKSRRQDYREMSAELGISCRYISQLRAGVRSTANINQRMVDACAKYLGVPGVVIKLVANNIRLSEFLSAHETEEQLLDRVIRKVQNDPHLSYYLPPDLLQLTLPAKKAVALMYAETAGHEIFGHAELPSIVRFLQRAAMFHDSNEIAALEDSLITS